MLEDYVAFYLQKYLGKYVKGVSKEALKISAWQGNVELTNMQLKPEALLELKLPIKVKAGFLGSVKLKVPWSRLGQEPVIVSLDRIFVLAEPSFNVEGSSDDAVQEARYQYIKEAETAHISSMKDQGQQQQGEMNNSWMGSLIGTIIANIKLSVTNIHIRFEDTESNPEQPFAIGVTLEKLAAVTVDENGKELFVSGGGALDKIKKSGELKRLAFYFDCKSKPWDLDWQNLSPQDWSKAFEPGIHEDADKIKFHEFLLQPVDGMARYSKLGTRDERSADKPAQTATVVLENVTLCLSEPQYRDVLMLFDNISAFNLRVEHAHIRPKVTIAEDPVAWWHYALEATKEKNRKDSGYVNWDQVLHHARMRKQYLSSYAKCLLANPGRVSVNDDEGIKQLESKLDKNVIVQWRILAHSLADQAKRQNAEHEKEQSKKSWWPFGWGGQSDGDGEPRGLSDDEWHQLNQAIGYEEGKPSTMMPGHDAPNMLHTILEVQMHYNASKLLSENEQELLTLSCEGLQSRIRLYSEAKDFDLKLESYKICCPEGLLAESANHLDALGAKFSLSPVNEDLDWSLSAGASPCYITYHKASIDRVIAFFSSRPSVSREVQIQTAAAFQMTLDEVTRKTQQQVNEALRNRPRFSLFLDIAAPKVTIPTNFYPKRSQRTKLMLDLGHFKMKTERGDEQRMSQEESEMYMCFKMQLNDVSGFLVDGDCDWDAVHSSKSPGVLPVIEKCAVFALLQQICVPHPLYPSTRVAVRVPSVAVHFSPARYHRLMQVVELLQGSSTDVPSRPWEPADFEGELSVLAWKGMGNREAVWNHRYGALAGPSFYILESPSSESYEHCVSLFGKQVYLIPPESVGGISHVLALCDPEQFSKKVVESVSAVILRFKDEDTLENWRTHFVAIIRKLNSSQAVIRGTAGKDSEDKNVSEKETLFLTGTLDELKICIASNKTGQSNREQVLLGEEGALLELRAVGSKVEFLMRDNDMAVGAALLSLEIEDRWYGQTSPSCRYLARSTISESEVKNQLKESITRENSPAERFFDSSEQFDFDRPSQENGSGNHGLSRRSSSQFYDADSSFHEKKSEFARTHDLLPRLEEQNVLTFGRDQELKSFIKAQVILSSPEATSYSNIDKQVKLSLATLAFYLNRPTLIALLDFVTAINTEVEPKSDASQSESGDSKDVVSLITPADVHQSGTVPMFDRKDSVVKGLLGTGKVRVVFLLVLDMDRAQLVLNRDDGHQLATLSQEHLHVTVKVFPASYAIVATLGNLRITDDSLKEGHPYHWLVDMRDPAGKSFVELEFVSFNEDDDDYEGYEFSLSGQLSEVRVVYLNRFIQEISSYFMGLVPADTGYIVKLKDKVSDAEKTFTQSEVEGAPAMKLDLSLNKPIVIFPKDTNSNSFLELDILHIHVINTFQWLGGGKEDIGGIRLELMSLKVENIHLVVSVDGKFGENIIKDSSGLVVTVRRTLRDLRRQLPAIDTSVEVQLLKAAMSDKEYQLMIDCCTSNLSEAPSLSPPVSQPPSAEKGKDQEKEDKEKETPQSETTDVQEGSTSASNASEVWTTLKLTVDVSIIELAVFVGRTQYTPLASIQVSGVWAAFKMSSNEEQYIMASLDSFNVTDDREGIESELKFMIGKASDDSSLLNRDETDGSRLVMLVLDAKLSPASQMITLRIQRPRVLLALDFLLAVAEFFIPSIADMLASSTKGTDELPYDMKNWLFLHKSPYFQDSDEVTLSPKLALVADDENIDKYIYDGGGGRIRLTDASGDPIGDSFEGPLVVVGHGKSLRFRNVVIENARCLDRFVLLGSNSSYSASKHDGVFLEWKDDQPSKSDENDNKKDNTSTKTELTFDLQAIGPELVMHTSGGNSSDIKDQLLCAKMDIFSRLVMKGDDLEVAAKANNFCVQGRKGIYVLEPVDTNCRYSRVSSKQNLHATISDVVCNLTFSMIQLILKLQEDAQSLLLLTSKKIAVECTEFDKIWADEVSSGSSQIAFWRPRAPPGFTILGDCLTVLDEPPSKGVIAMNMNLVHLKKPVDFRLVWSSSENADDSEQCCVWLPVAPEGYVVLGCVASLGRSPPSASPTLCVLKQFVTEWYMRDCIQVQSTNEQEWAFWRADNSTGSFFPVSALRYPHNSRVYELRHVAFEHEKAEDRFGTTKTNDEPVAEDNGLLLTTVTRFKLVWWDKGAKSKKSISIWRPVTPSRCVILGDIAVEGYEPPGVAFTLQDTQDGVLLQKPLKFVKMGAIHEKKGLKAVTFWFPVSPPGYVALGCLAVRGYTLDAEAGDKIRCVRNDLVLETEFSSPSLWDGRQVKRLNEDISIWPLQTMDYESKAATFVTNITQEAPPKQLAFKLKDVGNQSNTDNLVGDGEIRRVSATIFDDFGGMVAPLVNVSLNGLTASVHGTSDAMKSTANFSMVATSYNGRCDAWEPLIENTEGYVRYTKESTSRCSSQSQVSLAATSDFNINVSTANINMLLDAYSSWIKLTTMEAAPKGRGGEVRKQTVQERKLQIVCHNDLGQKFYCRHLDEDSNIKITPLESGNTETFRTPSVMSLQDPFTNESVRRKSVTLLTLELCDAEVPKDDGFGGRQYVVAVRLLPQLHTAEQHQFQYQSARTRCVNPSGKAGPDGDRVSLSWNEVFSFSIENVQAYRMEALVTDLAKGAPAGYCCIASLQELKSFSGTLETDLYAGASDQVNHHNPVGKIRFAYRFHSVARSLEDSNLRNVERTGLDPGTIEVGPSREGPWTKLSLTLASKSSYLKIGSEAAAREIGVIGGVKHVTVRSLVRLQNNTSVTMEVSLFPHFDTQDSQGTSTISEEIFENERYQPMLGWGSSWPGHLMPLDPGRWSKRDLSGSSQEFPQVELPLGWEWSSDWFVDTSVLDPDGWVHGFSFKRLTDFPGENYVGKLNFVRRRRWLRTRVRTLSLESSRCILGSVKPGEAIGMPLACFREARQDYSLQLRPEVEADGGYGWTQAVLCQTRGQKKLPAQEINVRSLLTDQILSSCLLEAPSAVTAAKSMWFCLDVNFIDIGKDAYIGPVRDCQLMLSAPLKILNHLPVSAEFSVHDSSRIRGYRMQDKGSVSSGETAEVYSADVRRPVYLSFIPEGSWHPTKELVLISHPFWDVAKFMILENLSTKRKIKVHIEYDYDEEVTARVLRISVPFWIDCARCPPLRLKVVDIDNRPSTACLPSTISSTSEEVLDDILYSELQHPFTMISPFTPKSSGMAASLASDTFGAVSPLADLDTSDGTVEVVATDGKCYFRLLVTTALCPIKFAHTKVVTIRPYITFTNRFGGSLFIKQASQGEPCKLNSYDWRTSFPVSSISETLSLQVRTESSQWSYPITIDHEETNHFYVQDDDKKKYFIRVEVRSHQEGSKFVLVFRRGSLRGPYRIENRTRQKRLRFRQMGTSDEDWEVLYPNCTRSFALKSPSGEHILEFLPEGVHEDKIFKYDLHKLEETSSLDINIRGLVLHGFKLIKLTDSDSKQEQPSEAVEDEQSLQPKEATNQLKIVLDIGKLGFSIIDQRPQEIFYLYLESFKFSILNSFQENTTRFKVRFKYLQLDDQNILSASPVVFAPDTRGLPSDENVLKASVIVLNDKEEGTQVYPYVGFWVTKRPWRINIHEPVIWTAIGMYNNIQLDSLPSNSQTVEADPEIRNNLIDISEAHLRVTLQTEPGLRPRGVLGIWSPLISLAGNTSKMAIHISGVTLENRYMRQSEVPTAVLNHIRKDLVHQALQLLLGVNVFGVASSTFETLSKSAADLSRDENFQQVRLKQDRLKHVSGVGDGLLRGGEALARGFAFGLSGVVKKPVNSAREHGFVGFFQGIGKAFTGFIFQPISGVLDFIALTVDGVNITYTRCFEVFTHERSLTRVRLPRAIRSDGVLLPYDERAALGQAMLQLAEDHNFGQNMVFKEPAKFALTDFYEDHFDVPENRVVMITNRRIILISQPSSYKSNSNVSPSNPCKVLWEIPYMELLAVETAKGAQSTCFVVLHLRNDPKTFAQVIKCSTEGADMRTTEQILESIRTKWTKYGPDRQTVMSKMRKWQQTRSMPTPRASKRALASDRKDTDEEPSDSSAGDGRITTKEVILFEQIWKSEQDSSVCCTTFSSVGAESGVQCTIWRPIVPDGYVSIGDIAYHGTNPPTVTVSYKNNNDGTFALPTGFDLVWRNWKDGYEPVTIWKPRAPAGYESLGYVASQAYVEPEVDVVWCARSDTVEPAEFVEQALLHARHPWHCFIYQVHNDALTFFVSREAKKCGATRAAKRIAAAS